MKQISLDNNLEKIIATTTDVLQQGGLVIFPSDTVYGLLVDATNEQAVEKLIKFKNRPPGKAISVFVADMAMLDSEVKSSPVQKKLLEQLIPGPFTIIFQSQHRVSPKLESEKGNLGIRLPQYDPVVQLTQKFGRPITATSANIGGRHPHYSIESLLNDIPQEKKDLIDLIVDAGKLSRNKPSTIIDLTQPEVKIIRHGDVIWKNSQTFISRTPTETRKTAEFILSKHSVTASSKPLVFILQGDLGVGKTIFVKGLAEKLGITDSIISPTFVIYYEYELKQSGKFIHADLYNIEDPEEFKYLHLEELLENGNVLAIEWGEKLGELYEVFKQKANVVYIRMNYINETEREIIVST